MKNLFVALALCVSCLSSQAFEKTDPHFVVGSGDKQCYFVVDWYGAQKCWAYKWGDRLDTPTVFDALKEIDHEDPRFVIKYQQMTAAYVDVYFMGYDEDDCACQFDTENGGSSSPNALVGVEDKVWYSQWWVFYQAGSRTEYGSGPIYSSWDAANSVQVQDEQVYYFTIGAPEYDSNWAESPITIDASAIAYAESPYGWRVVDYYTSCPKANFNAADNVLHRPTTYMKGTWGGPITPYNPAWMANELLSLEDEGDFVVIEFDHKVVDDPKNPYGYDFIAFGNSLIVGTKKDYYEESSDPGNWEYTQQLSGEPALVEVSADGETWFSYNDGPYCDDWAPTQGLVYDKSNYNTNWYAANRWWSCTTDATWPVHPGLTSVKAVGETIETLSYKYDKSAGGAAFDISGFPLPTDEHGRKYIKFVRIRPMFDEEEEEWTAPEIDAVADVRPCTAYEEWRLANYSDYRTQWDALLTGKKAIAANGYPNVVNQLLGLGANESPVIGTKIITSATGEQIEVSDVLGFSITGISVFADYVDLQFRHKGNLTPDSGLFIKTGSDLTSGLWSYEMPSISSVEDLGDGTKRSTLRVSNSGQFFRFAVGDE